MRKLLLPALAAALVGAAAPALAGEVTIHVSADGLDFTHATDIAAMKSRIDVAVRKACAGTDAVNECVSDGTAKAMAELDARLAAQS